MKKMSAVFAAAALACTLNLTAAAQDKPAPKLKRVQMAKEREMHPEISAAMTHLREAKQNLENAKHDFGGHRASALKHVTEAMEECRLALEFKEK